MTDGSIEIKGYRPFEVVSPILRGDDGLQQVRRVLNGLKEMGAVVNESTGHHVHVDAENLSMLELKRIAQGYVKYETAFDLLQPASRQLDDNRYLQSNRLGAEDRENGPFQAILALEKVENLSDLVDVINPAPINCAFEPGTPQYERMLDNQRYYKVSHTDDSPRLLRFIAASTHRS